MHWTPAFRHILLATAAITALLPGSAWAQVSPAPEQPAANAKQPAMAGTDSSGGVLAPGDIIVTARRRNETSIAIPVAVTAVAGVELQRRGINNVDALARTVPTLITSEATSSPQGGIVAIRGLSGVDANPLGDQAVSFNIDGVQVARSSVRRLSQMDVAQIEVLKGPQALFFGKNSPGGIISIRSADPGNEFRAQFSSGYEFKADETRNEGFISTPVTDTLGIRIAGYYDYMKGYVRNIAPSTGVGVFAPFDRRVPNGTEYAARGTLKWEPSDSFNARLKLSYSNIKSAGSTDNLQHLACPLGVPQASSFPEDCVADGKTTSTDNIGPNFEVHNPNFRQETYLFSRQFLGGLELNYKVGDDLTITSTTGLYRGSNGYLGNFEANFAETGTLPKGLLVARSGVRIRELTEELRLTSSFDGPVNFMFGGLYQDSKANSTGNTLRNAFVPVTQSYNNYLQNGIAYSVFGQMQVKLVPTLELSVGGRYSYEDKKLGRFRVAIPTAPLLLVDVDAPNRATFNNLSPEITLSYRPTNRLTVYGAYKEGFLSGGFNGTQAAIVTAGGVPVRSPTTGNYIAAADARYGQQTIQGFEGGVKTALLDNNLRLNLNLYNYETKGLQVAVLVGLTQILSNAGAVRTKGVEFDFSYRTPVEGLSLNGAVSYEHGRYTDYQAVCYRGLPAPQCRNQVNRFTNAVGLLNDLSGTQLVRAPTWSGNVGFDYVSRPIGGFKFGINGNASHSDSFFTDVVSAPGGRQKAYQLYDAGLRVMDAEEERWELALIGRNLGNTYYFTRSADNPSTGSAPGGPAATAFRGDTVGVPSRGREIMVKATIRFGG